MDKSCKECIHCKVCRVDETIREIFHEADTCEHYMCMRMAWEWLNELREKAKENQ